MEYDVIVIGVGSMGSSACYHLANRGASVLGIEQFDISHEFGSHTGQTRLIRKAYFEHSDYVPLLLKSYDGWRQIEKEASQQLYWETGIAYFGEEKNTILKGVRSASAKHGIRLEQLTNDQVEEKWPPFNIPKHFASLFEPEAGFITPENAIRAFVQLAQTKGAEIHTNEKVVRWKQYGSTVTVETDQTTYTAKKLIITAGAYTHEILPDHVPLKVTRQWMGWAIPKTTTGLSLGDFPCWMITPPESEGLFYGFPMLPGDSFGEIRGLKIAYHRPGEMLTTKNWNDASSSEAEAEILNGVMKDYFPSIDGEIAEMQQCKYSYSPDEHFIVDQLATYSNQVIIACGFSGHGFKFVPVIGEALADLALTGKTSLPIGFLGIGRFG